MNTHRQNLIHVLSAANAAARKIRRKKLAGVLSTLTIIVAPDGKNGIIVGMHENPRITTARDCQRAMKALWIMAGEIRKRVTPYEEWILSDGPYLCQPDNPESGYTSGLYESFILVEDGECTWGRGVVFREIRFTGGED
ncbi:MAG: hypothetical protein LUE08_07045 [Akkermansiaceae bacterium]|nr:hypothetical protein [Akkermansiaceae bacterium]